MTRSKPAERLLGLGPLAAGLAICLGWSGSAFAFGIGVEAGATGTWSNYPNNAISPSGSNAAGGAALGLILEEEFDVALVFLDVWADGQLNTLRLQTGGTDASTYLPFDLGLRVGLAFAVLHPYVGVLGQMAFPTSDGGGPNLTSPIFGAGGDLGLDIAVFIFRFGVEIRGVETLSPLVSDATVKGVPTNAFEFQGLGSARFSF